MMFQSNNKEIKEIKETYKVDNKTFAMYIETSNGNYEEYTTNSKFPKGCSLNMAKSNCVDSKGSTVAGVLTSAGNNVTVTSKKTVFCYLYFDPNLLDISVVNPPAKKNYGIGGTFNPAGMVVEAKYRDVLPEGYIELEYIESTGTQYIDTGVIGNLPIKAEIKMQTKTGTSTTDSVPLGVTDGSNFVNPFYLFQGMWHFNGTNSATGYLADNTIYEATAEMNISGGTLTVNGNNIVTTSTNQGSVSSYPMYLFARNDWGTATRLANIKLYELKIYKDNNLVRDFVPVINSNGEVGMYDLVEGKFYGNDGTGSFIPGMPKELPEGYTQLEYIESTGTQYIDTGVSYSNSKSFKTDMKLTYTTVEPANQIFGFTGNRGMGIGTSGIDWWEVSNPDIVIANTIYDITWTKSYGDFNRIINGNENAGTDGLTQDYNGNLYLFAAMESYNSMTLAYFSSSKLYFTKIYVNNELERFMIPAKNSNGEVGMYDLVERKFYGNNGTGTFVEGKEIKNRARNVMEIKPTLPSGYTALDYIESTGTQYIDTGFKPNQDTKVDVVAMPFDTNAAGMSVGFIPFGSGESYNSRAFECYSGAGGFEMNYGNNYEFVGTIQANQIVKIVQDKNSVYISTPENIFTYTHPTSSFTSPYSMYLFAINRSSVIPSGQMRMYEARIYDNGKLIRHYIPAKNSSGEIGLYDLVENKFYGNNGTGSFVAGPEAKTYTIVNGSNLTDGQSSVTVFYTDGEVTKTDDVSISVGATVKITLLNLNYRLGSIYYNGVQQTDTFIANIGDTIEIEGIQVAINNPSAVPSLVPNQMYQMKTSYTVISDAVFEYKNKFSGNTQTGMYYLLSINEVSEGKALVQITGSGSQNAPIVYVEHNGVKYYYATSIVVNIGDTIFCKANAGIKGAGISHNGTSVGSISTSNAEYTYTVTSNATIYLSYSGSAYDSGGGIQITDN